jgi:hypothetical protein
LLQLDAIGRDEGQAVAKPALQPHAIALDLGLGQSRDFAIASLMSSGLGAAALS